MKPSRLIVMLLVYSLVPAAFAGGSDFDLSWYTMDGGGGTSSGIGLSNGAAQGETAECEPQECVSEFHLCAPSQRPCRNLSL